MLALRKALFITAVGTGTALSLPAQTPGCYNNCGAPVEKAAYRLSTTDCSAPWPGGQVGLVNYGSYTVTVFYDAAFANSDTGSTDQEQTSSPSSSGVCYRYGDPNAPYPFTGGEQDCDPYWRSSIRNVTCTNDGEGSPSYEADVAPGIFSGYARSGLPDCGQGEYSVAALFMFNAEQCEPCPSQNDFGCDIDVDRCTYYGGCPPDYYPDDWDACCLIG